MRRIPSMAASFGTGSAPGNARHTGQQVLLGSSPNDTGQPQNILEAVCSSTWVSIPMTIAGRQGNNDWWHVKLGQFVSGTHVEYAIVVADGGGKDHWFSDGGNNYHAYVK